MLEIATYGTYVQKDVFVIALQKDPKGLDPDIKWEAYGRMHKKKGSSRFYTLGLTCRNEKFGTIYHEFFMKPVSDFSDENGILCMDRLIDAVLKLHDSLALREGTYDSPGRNVILKRASRLRKSLQMPSM